MGHGYDFMDETPMTYVAHSLFTFNIASAGLPANQERDLNIFDN